LGGGLGGREQAHEEGRQGGEGRVGDGGGERGPQPGGAGRAVRPIVGVAIAVGATGAVPRATVVIALIGAAVIGAVVVVAVVVVAVVLVAVVTCPLPTP